MNATGDYSYAVSRSTDGKPLCNEAAEHEMEAERARIALRGCWPGTPECHYQTIVRDHALNAAADAIKAHAAGVCSCFVRMRVNADRKRRGLDPV